MKIGERMLNASFSVCSSLVSLVADDNKVRRKDRCKSNQALEVPSKEKPRPKGMRSVRSKEGEAHGEPAHFSFISADYNSNCLLLSSARVWSAPIKSPSVPNPYLNLPL
jgi:hypothetical protein